MTGRAKYRGLTPMYGVEKNETYTLDMMTYDTEHGTPYIWIRIFELPEYLMPYSSMAALITDWDFSPELVEFSPITEQIDLVNRWMEMYSPELAGAI